MQGRGSFPKVPVPVIKFIGTCAKNMQTSTSRVLGFFPMGRIRKRIGLNSQFEKEMFTVRCLEEIGRRWDENQKNLPS